MNIDSFLRGFARGLEKRAFDWSTATKPAGTAKVPGSGGESRTVRISRYSANELARGQRMGEGAMSGVAYPTSQKLLVSGTGAVRQARLGSFFKPSLQKNPFAHIAG